MNADNCAKAKRVIKACNAAVRNWDERSQFNILGVGNLSASDVDTILIYADQIQARQGDFPDSLMRPVGGVKAVLEAAGIELPSRTLGFGYM